MQVDYSIDVKANGTSLRPEAYDQLLECRVHRPLNAPAQATLRFADDRHESVSRQLFDLGKEVAISFADADDQRKKVFVGEVVSIGAESDHQTGSLFIVTCYDRSHRMSLTVTPQTHVKMTTVDLLKKLAASSKLQLECREPARPAPWSTTSSMLQLLEDITARFGWCWAVDDDKLRVFKPDVTQANTVALEFGSDLRRFSTDVSAIGSNTDVEVFGWDRANDAAITAKSAPRQNPFAHIGYDPKTPAIASKVTAVADPAASSQDAKERAEALNTLVMQDAISCRGETMGISPDLTPGGAVELKGVGAAFSGKYLLTEVEHVLTGSGSVRTRFRGGSIARPLFARGTQRHQDPGTQPMIGIVTAHWASGGDPGLETMVKVKLPAMGDSYETTWAPVVTPLAAGNSGLVVVPDVNDQVVVIFEGGNIDRPLVIGSMWTSKAKVEMKTKPRSGAQQEYRLATKWGSVLALTHVSDSEDKIELSTKDAKSSVTMTPTLIKVVSSENKTIELSTGQASIVLKDGADVTIKGNNVTIEATQALKLVAKSNLTAESQGQLGIKGATAKVEAQATLDLAGQGITTVKGGMVKIN